jgi:hypothetical protein
MKKRYARGSGPEVELDVEEVQWIEYFYEYFR